MSVSWSDVGRMLTTGHRFVIYRGIMRGDLICDKCAWVIEAGRIVDDDDICPGPLA